MSIFYLYACVLQRYKSCIKLLKQSFPEIKVIKGRPRHPQTQGCIEKNNDTLKKGLDKWIADHTKPGKKADWSKTGAFSVLRGINSRPHESWGMTVPFETYFIINTSCDIEKM